ncbi:gp53-like domain-containing protein [Pseudomonas sp. D47]|uniref:gp53-like domain-containing protein n=1 Tax=Pseudomonas sp. D47 TaxID=3159447 RepID=UPI00387B63AF
MALKLNERYPGRFNSPSAGYPAGSFKNRTTPDSKDGSYLEQDWANDKEGFFQSIISASGVGPNGLVDKVGASQFFDSLLQLSQNQVAQAFTTGGTATALTLTPVPAISAYAAKLRFNVTFNVGGGANPTINVSGRGAINLKQYNSTGAKVAAVFSAGQNSDILYDGVDFILLSQLPTISNGLQYRSMFYLSGATTISAATHAGSILIGLSNTAFNVQLPLVSSAPESSTFTFFNYFPGTMKIVCAGSDDIATSGNSPTMDLAQGMSVTLVSNNGTSWFATGVVQQATELVLGAAKFATQSQTDTGTDDTTTVTPKKLRSGFVASFGTNGYVKFPSWLGGLTIQWGSVNGSNSTNSFPLAFANACTYLGATAQIDSNSPGADGERQVSAFVVSNSQYRLRNGTANGLSMKWLAVGY